MRIDLIPERDRFIPGGTTGPSPAAPSNSRRSGNGRGEHLERFGYS
jgi:hypothetical protein